MAANPFKPRLDCIFSGKRVKNQKIFAIIYLFEILTNENKFESINQIQLWKDGFEDINTKRSNKWEVIHKWIQTVFFYKKCNSLNK